MSGIIAQNTLDNSGLIKSPAGGGAWTFIKKLTASSSATLSFVDGSADVVLDSTYAEYIFYFVDIHPSANGEYFQWQANAAAGSGYNETITSTSFAAVHYENDSAASVAYQTGDDQAQGTSYQTITEGLGGTGNDESVSGYLYLFAPSSTTFVKHFMSRTSSYRHSDASNDMYNAGYINTTSAIDDIQFKMSSGNIDSGKIKMFGIKDS